MNKVYLAALAVLLASCTITMPHKQPPLVEVVDIGTCDGGMCVWKTPAGSTIIIIRDTKTVHGGAMRPMEPGKITMGAADAGMRFENFTFIGPDDKK